MRFAERFALPVATTFRRAHLFDPLHPCYAGDLGIGPNPKLLARVKGADLDRPGRRPARRDAVAGLHAARHSGADADARARASRASRNSAASTAPQLAINATPTAFAAALEGLQPPNDIRWRDETPTAHADFLAWTDKPTAVPGAGQSRRDRRRLARQAAGRRRDLQRRRQFLDLGASLLSLSPLRHRSSRRSPARWATACRRRSAMKRLDPERTVVCVLRATATS